MNLLSKFNTFACLTVALGIAAYCAAEESIGLGVLAIPACIAGWWTARGSRSLMLPRGMVNLLVLIAIVHAAMRATPLSPENPLVSVLTEFLVYIQLVKLFDRRTARDDGQLLGLSLFIVIGAILSSNSLPLGLVILFYTPIAASAAMLLQLTLATPRTTTPRGEPPDADSGPRAIAGRRYSRHFLMTTSGAVLFAMLGAAAIFVAAPRGLGERVFGRFGVASGGATIGFSDSVRLGHAGRLSESSRIVADVALKDRNGNAIGSSGPLYLRGATLDVYSRNGVWRASSGPRDEEPHDLDVLERRPSWIFASYDRTRSTVTQEITLRSPPREGRLFSIYRPFRISTDSALKPVYNRRDATLRHGDSGPGRLRYTVESQEFQSAEAVAAFAAEGGAAVRLRSEFPLPRVEELATSILERAGIALPLDGAEPATLRRAAASIQDYLRTTCAYTTDLTAPLEDEDPIEGFLFRHKQGHCEYFASAMTAMCQSVGIPARIVTGYYSSEFNAVAGQYVVRESDAHAWVEVQIEPGRWTRFDPSPPASIEELRRRSGGVFAAIRRWYDTLEVNWAQSFVGFDSGRQARLFGNKTATSAGNAPAMLRKVDSAWASTREFLNNLGSLRGGVGLALRIAMAATVLLAVAWLVRRALGRARLPARRTRTGVAFYDDALRTLARAGLAKPHHLPPELHATRVDPFAPEAAALLRRIASAFYAVRFGGAPAKGPHADEARRAASDLRSLLARTPPTA